MKVLKKEVEDGKFIILTCQRIFLFGLIKKQVKFIATIESPKGYWNWVTFPNAKTISDDLSFRLDFMCINFEKLKYWE